MNASEKFAADREEFLRQERESALLAEARVEARRAACEAIAERMEYMVREKWQSFAAGKMKLPTTLDEWALQIRAFGQTGRWPDSREGGKENT